MKISRDLPTGNNSDILATSRKKLSKKRAVLIGITYAGTKDVGPLPNSADHLALFHNLLIRKLGFDKRNIWLLSDKPYSAAGAILLEPTRENILNAMKWLVVNAKPGDDLIFAYRGHGVQRRRNDLRSVIQCIIPSDYPTGSLITKETISSVLIEELNIGVRLTVILDCRFSNQMLNLPHVHCVRQGKKNRLYVSDSVEVDDKDLLHHLSLKRGVMGYSRQHKEYLELKKEVEEEQREALAATLFEKGDLVCLTRGAETPKKLISFSSRREQTTLSSAFVSVVSDNLNHSHERALSFHKLLTEISLVVGKGNDSSLPQLWSSYKLKIEDQVFRG
ncbi:ICE-like protease p20 domain protein [Gracilaria domingensis]|nr:ICE-like protease p20 domain protein [Gracilaria domingensis]